MSERSIRRARKRRTVGLTAGGALGATLLFTPAADAATFTVTSTADTDEAEGTLREEIEDANETAGDDTIVFDASVTGTITLTGTSGGDIEIYDDGLDIQGPGASDLTIAGDGSDRLFELFDFNETTDEVIFYGLTLTGGQTFDSGGAIASDIDATGYYAADVTIAGSVLTGNDAGASGGAFYTFYSGLTVTDSEITNNVAGDSGGGVYAWDANFDGSTADAVSISGSEISDNASGDAGGGLYTQYGDGNLVIEDSTFRRNFALNGDGGGIRAERLDGDIAITGSKVSGNYAGATEGGGAQIDHNYGSVTVSDSTFANNFMDGWGGGASLYDNDGAVTVSGTTFSGNEAEQGGGGAALWGNGDSVVVRNSTVSGNTADADGNGSGEGGGLYSYNRASAIEEDTQRRIHNTTITENSAASGGGIYAYLYDNGVDDVVPDVLEISSTIVSGNDATDQGDDFYLSGVGGYVELGNSFVGSTADAQIVQMPAGTNEVGTDPQLHGLDDASGPTKTHVPIATSPVLDSGVANALSTDQRGLTRNVDLGPNDTGSDGTDTGAVERQTAEPTQTSIDSGPADGSSTNDPTPTFTFSSKDPSPTFQCSLVAVGAADSFAACNTGTFTPGSLANGVTYVFKVKATSGGNEDPTPATRTFTVDTSEPDTTITSGPAEGSTTTNATVSFGFSSTEAGSKFECSINGSAFVPCSGPGRSHSTTLGDGTHTFSVRARDAAGNVDPVPATRTFTVDTTAPQTTIDSGPADGATINDPTPTFEFSSNEPGSTFECSFGGGFDPCSGPGETHTPPTPLADGTHTFRVRATDPVGHVDSSPAERTFTVDTSVPAVPPLAETAKCQGDTVPKQEGTDGNDAIAGTGTVDAIFGLAGNDTLTGKGGKDCLNGGGGKDKLKGGAGKDKLKGGPGKDKLSGGGGKDRFNCGGGKDKVTAQPKDKVSASCEKVVEKG